MGRMRELTDFVGFTRPPRGSTRPWQSHRLIEWSKRHPVLDGMFLGVPTLALMVLLPAVGVADIPLIIGLAVALAAVGIGALMGCTAAAGFDVVSSERVTYAEAARHLGVGESTVRTLLRHGVLEQTPPPADGAAPRSGVCLDRPRLAAPSTRLA